MPYTSTPEKDAAVERENTAMLERCRRVEDAHKKAREERFKKPVKPKR